MMPRSKQRGPALFERLNEGATTAPGAFKVSGSRRKRDKRAKTRAADRTFPEGAAGMAGASEAGTRVSGGNVPFVELDGNRVRLSFTSVTAAVALFAGLVVVLGAFELGRSSGDEDGFRQGYAAGRESYATAAMSEIEAARSQPPAASLLSGLLEEPQDNEAPADTGTDEVSAESTQPRWIRGYTYIVAQEFSPGSLGGARQAQEFLARHGVATELVRYPSGVIQLLTTQGYNHKDPAQRQMANELLKKVHTIGAEYFAAGGGYKLEGYFKTLKNDTW